MNFSVNTELNELSITKLEAEIARLKAEKEAIEAIFTEGQIKKLKNPNKRISWTVDDISRAITIYSAGPRAYRLLRKKGYPFPAPSTLRDWCKKIEIRPGILTQIFDVIKQTELTEMEKICVLSYDEMKVRSIYLYDRRNDQTLHPMNYVQVVMLRGLVGNWKQPIFFEYDCKLTKDKLFEIIKYVENAGFHIVASVSDMGGGNRALLKELGISATKTWFSNPANENPIYVFADVPHLIKLIRNHFIDQGFIYNGKEINKTVIEKLITWASASDLNIAHKITMD